MEILLHVLIDTTNGYILGTNYDNPYTATTGTTTGVTTNQTGVAFEINTFKYNFTTNLFETKRPKYKIYELIDSTATFTTIARVCPKTIDNKTSSRIKGC